MEQGRGDKKNKWRFRKVLFMINVPVAMALMMSILSQFVSPEKFWPLIFYGLAFPFLFVAHIVLSCIWFLRSWKVGVLGLLIACMCWKAVDCTYGLHYFNSEPKAGSFKVMTYNVRLFDYYNWSRNIHTRHWMYDFLKNQQPDILCIQEFFHDNTGYFPTLDTLREVNSIKHMHLENYQKLKIDQQWGMATLTRFPIIRKGRIEFPSTFGNMAIFSDLVIDQDTVRVYNVHLQSVRFNWDDYKVMDKLMDKHELKDAQEGKRLLLRVQDATVKRASQAELVAAHIASSPYPVIVCGDLNDSPVSYTYRTMSRGLIDTFDESGRGIGATYTKIPFLRIDHILHDRVFTATDHTVHPWELSDHFAVTAQLERN